MTIRATYKRMEIRSVPTPAPEGKTGDFLTFQTPGGEQFGPVFRDTEENRVMAKEWLTRTGHDVIE
jgi:hypothetical protein